MLVLWQIITIPLLEERDLWDNAFNPGSNHKTLFPSLRGEGLYKSTNATSFRRVRPFFLPGSNHKTLFPYLQREGMQKRTSTSSFRRVRPFFLPGSNQKLCFLIFKERECRKEHALLPFIG
ncbi:hypothetical protein D7004_06825 [Pedobacter jejuensis]|uniref:Uncharacterized protein n=1 Tax=Pedobacter jejuensis TaxID=1268550 RepID=A0A3N0BXL5_9SPHI|nr:hypothetical protein D7004_06825 [Pedobacter jejuensis]